MLYVVWIKWKERLMLIIGENMEANLLLLQGEKNETFEIGCF